jgi:heat shock protein HslJ
LHFSSKGDMNFFPAWRLYNSSMGILRYVITLFLLVLILLLATACTGNGTRLADSQWAVVSINGDILVNDRYLSLNLWADDTLWGYNGVNSYEGKWESSANRIRFYDISCTEIGVSPELTQQEESYFNGLKEACSYTIEKNDLRLLDSSGRERVMLRCVAEDKADHVRLAGTEWELEAINSTPITDNTTMSLFFDELGNARGQAGPFYYETDFQVSGNSIRSTGNTVSRVGRPEETGGKAEKGMSVLAMATNYQLNGSDLMFLSVKGDTASFRRYHSPYKDYPKAPGLKIQHSEASWAYMMEDMGQLCEFADLIVMGTGRGFVGLNKEVYGTNLHAWQSAFRVEAVFKGTAEKEIILSHTVIEYPDGNFRADETDPPVKAGERWILFLRADSDGTYTENGPWGRYQVIDRKVYSMNRVIGENNPYYITALDFDGEELIPFITKVTGTLRSLILTFYDERLESPCTVFPCHAPGQSGNLVAKLSTGWTTHYSIKFTVKRVTIKGESTSIPMPSGLRVWMAPSHLYVESSKQYQLALKAEAADELPIGIYWLVVECRAGGQVIASRDVAVSIHPPEVED